HFLCIFITPQKKITTSTWLKRWRAWPSTSYMSTDCSKGIQPNHTTRRPMVLAFYCTPSWNWTHCRSVGKTPSDRRALLHSASALKSTNQARTFHTRFGTRADPVSATLHSFAQDRSGRRLFPGFPPRLKDFAALKQLRSEMAFRAHRMKTKTQ